MRTFTNELDVAIATQFRDSLLTASGNEHFVFAAKSEDFSSNTVPTPGKSLQESFYTISREILFGRKVSDSDVSLMVRKHDWTSGTVYAQYDHEDNDLNTKNFFVVTFEGPNYYIWKCLNNNNGSASTDKPLFAETAFDDDHYVLADGYHWKAMCSIERTQFEKFETASYAPLIHDANTSSEPFATDGAIEAVFVESSGSGYASYAYGSIARIGVDSDSKKIAIQTEERKNILDVGVSIETSQFAVGDTVVVYEFASGVSSNTIYETIATANSALYQEVGTVYSTDGARVMIDSAADYYLTNGWFGSSANTFVLSTKPTTSFTVNLNALEQGIQNAIAGDSTAVALFITTEISGRPLADLTNDGNVNSADLTGIRDYIADSTTYATYIEGTLLPYIMDNSDTYYQYLLAGGIATSIQTILAPNLSANTNFYTGSTLFVREGTGRGQAKKITAYNITGSEYVVTLESAFGTTLDSTSRFEILPTVDITGDGTGAVAIANINPGNNGIRDIEIVNPGSGYSYANVAITGNTGIIDLNTDTVIQANTAVARAIISPPGGHGADLENELFADKVGISVDFNSDLPTEGEYYRFGLIRNPSMANTEFFDARLTLDVSAPTTSFVVGETITQGTTTAVVHQYANNTIYATEVRGDFSTGSLVTGSTSGATSTINTITQGDYTVNTGQILFVENMSGITRQVDQTERLKIVVEF